MLSGLPIKKMV